VRIRTSGSWALVAIVAAGAALPDGARAQDAHELKVMTFNIRYGTGNDGDHAWPNRRALVAELIAGEAPDVLALQEALDFQLAELAPVLSGYRKLGQHRDGGTEGEFSGLYVRNGSVELVDWGEFWLSPTPEVVASVGWDAAITRMAVWADLRVGGSDSAVRVYGTHFDHRGERARVESARLIAAHADGAGATLIMGDLNVPEEAEAMQVFFEAGYRSAMPTLHPAVKLGTFNGFRDPGGGGRRIDHVLVSEGLELKAAAILDDRDGLFPSDHYPVVALLGVRCRKTSAVHAAAAVRARHGVAEPTVPPECAGLQQPTEGRHEHLRPDPTGDRGAPEPGAEPGEGQHARSPVSRPGDPQRNPPHDHRDDPEEPLPAVISRNEGENRSQQGSDRTVERTGGRENRSPIEAPCGGPTSCGGAAVHDLPGEWRETNLSNRELIINPRYSSR